MQDTCGSREAAEGEVTKGNVFGAVSQGAAEGASCLTSRTDPGAAATTT
jgi:hypothetical protein